MMKKNYMEKYKTINIPADLQKRFKAHCAKNGTTMMGVIIMLITKYLEE